jgi:hypothetical protein
MNHKDKVDQFSRIKNGFIVSTFVNPYGGVQFIPDTLKYANCNQPKAHKFIAAALEDHAALAGVEDVNTYIANLRKLGQGYDGR